MARKEKVFKTTLLVTLVILLSKAFGFGRDMILAYYFGTGAQNDAYVAAYSLFYLPVLLLNSCITATVIPLYTLERQERGLKHANHFASNIINLFIIVSVALSVLMIALSKPMVRMIYPGFDAERIAMTVRLERIMMISLLFNVSSIVFSSLLNASDKYLAAQLTGFPLSLAVIIASVFFSKRFGIIAVGWGVFAASVLQALMLIPFMRGWFSYSLVADFRDKRIHKLCRLAGPALLSMGISELNNMIDHALASGLNAGDISALNYAYRLITFLLGVLMVPLITVMFTRMSRMAAQKDSDGMLDVLRKCVCVIALAVLPIVAIAVVMSTDVIKFAYMRGQFGMESVMATAGALCFYVIGVPAFGLRDFLNRVFHSLQDTKTPFRVACLVVAINIILNLILRKFMGANGLALATSIAGITGMLVMFVLLHKRFGSLGFRRIALELIRIALAAAVCAAVCAGMNAILPEVFGMGRVTLRLIAATAVSGIAYLAACFVLRVGTLKVFVKEVLKR